MIKSLRLAGFKNFKNAVLDLGPFTVLVGTNASGKSNIRDAFRFVHGMARGYSLSEIIGEKYVEGGVLQWRGIRGGVREVAFRGRMVFGLETRISIGQDGNVVENDAEIWDATHKINVHVGVSNSPQPDAPSVSMESLITSHGPVYDSHLEFDLPEQEDLRREIYVRLPRDGIRQKRGKRLRFVASQPVLSQFSNNKNVRVKDTEPVDLILHELQSMRFLDLAPDAMRMPSIPGQIVLGDRGENLSSVLQAICNDDSKKKAITEWLRELTPLDVVDFDFVPDQVGRILLTLIESDGQRTSAYSASDGTLRFLAIIAALLGPDSAKFYFLEELDNGIHPTRLYLLLQLIEQHTSRGDVQIVTTTHSPQLLAMLSEESREHASLIYRLEHTADARIRRVMDIPEARRVLQEQNFARLHESGWLEDAVAFTEPVAEQSEEAT